MVTITDPPAGAPPIAEWHLAKFGLEPLVPWPDGAPIADASGIYLTLSVQKNPATTILQDTPTLLEVRDNVPVSGTPQRFIRLEVTRP